MQIFFGTFSFLLDIFFGNFHLLVTIFEDSWGFFTTIFKGLLELIKNIVYIRY